MSEFDMNHFVSRCAAPAVAALLALAAVAQSQPAAPPGSWTMKAPLPAARNETAAVAVNDKIYVMGGNFPGKNYDVAVNEEYDTAADRWRTLAPMPGGLNHLALAALGGRIYALGGFTSNGHKGVSASVFEYDIAGDTWRTLAPLPTPRGSVSAAAVGGKIHAFGGRKNETEVVATHEVYDPATGRWSAAAPLPKGRDHMAAVTVGGKIHVVGGRFGENEDMTGLHDIYDPATDTWTSAPPVPTPRGGGAGALYQGLVVFLGGEDDHRTYKENEAFDVANNRWITLAPMPQGRHGFGLAAAGRDLYVVSGAKGRGAREPTDETLVFRLPNIY
jgi:N-acetylneuraminic acid mutarotase